MRNRDRALAGLVVAAIHLAAFAPTIGSGFQGIDEGLWQQSEAILDGAKPYEDRNFEYPPLALPILVAPAAVSDGLDGYREAFELEMLVFDLGIVALLAFALAGPAARIWEALGIYTVGVVALSGVILPDSAIGEAPLALSRYDLAVALLLLAALTAREASRSALWGALLGAATAAKAFPALLVPGFLRGDRGPRRALTAALVPLAAAGLLVLALGDSFWSAIEYHSDRDLQIEALGAAPLLLGHMLFGTEAEVVTGAGGFNLTGPGAELARVLSLVLLAGGVLLLIYESWRRRTPAAVAAVAVLTTAIVLAPVLSPQFLLWVLPLSAAAYGLGRENLVLIGCLVLTEVMLHNYVGVEELSGAFVWTLTARNTVLVAYLVLVIRPIWRTNRAPRPAPPQGGARGGGGLM